MTHELYSVEQIADLLGLHVRTVRHYVRDGKLKATRIGKQYRIARQDLEAFTGQSASALERAPVRRQRHIEVSTVVLIDAVSQDSAYRLTTFLSAGLSGRSKSDAPARVNHGEAVMRSCGGAARTRLPAFAVSQAASSLADAASSEASVPK